MAKRALGDQVQQAMEQFIPTATKVHKQIEELNVGDWIAFFDMGAYTSAAASTFNGMQKSEHFYYRTKEATPKINL